jgi:hypothetical protein
MASPHITGTAALIKQAHPDWTDAEVLSAIMTTGSHDLVKEDGATPADLHDIGGGRVQVAAAIDAGLVLDETSSAFAAANPDDGGDPSALNVAGLVKQECVQACTWTRTVRATVNGSWTTSGLDSFVDVSPASFDLLAGETQEITVTADASTLPSDSWTFSRAVLTPADSNVPTSQLPIALVPVSGDLPQSVDIAASRDAGSQLFKDVTATALSDFNVKIFEPAKVEGMEYALPGDSDNSDWFDDLNDGVLVLMHDAPAGTQRALFEVLESESPDLDLFVGLVLDPSNPVDPGLLVCISATGTALESCDLDADFLDLLRSIFGPDLTFYAVIQNWEPSAPDAIDAFTFAATNVSDAEASRMYAEGPSGPVDTLVPFDVRFFWNLHSETGDRYISTTEWYADGARTDLLGKPPLNFDRGIDDVTFSSNATGPVNVGDAVTFTATIQPNYTPEDRTYEVSVKVPHKLEVDPASITDGGVMQGNRIVWNVTNESLLGQDGEYLVSTNLDNPYCSSPFGDGGYVNLADFGILPDPTFTGDNIAGTFFSGQNPIAFFNGVRDGGLTVTDDGFGFFESTPGPIPYINMPIPTDLDPNDMLAPFWSDWVVNFDDGSSGRIRGVTAATAGPDFSIVEWDGVEWYPGDGTYPISADFELMTFSTVDPDFPEFIFAYDNLDPGFIDLLLSLGYITSGIENRDGTVGTEYMGAYSDGLLVCYDYLAPDSSPKLLSFTATVKPQAHGRTVTLKQKNTVDNPGSRQERSRTSIEVNKLPYIFSGYFWLYDGKTIDVDDISNVPVSFMLFDPVTYRPAFKADANVEITDAAGNVVASGDAKYRWLRYVYWWRVRNLEPGDYTVTTYLDDGTSHSVTVTLVDDDDDSDSDSDSD